MSKFSLTRPPKIFFMTFGAGNIGIQNAAQRLGSQAVESGFFDEVEVFSYSDLPPKVTELFAPATLDECRGFGFWAWKPYLINQKMESLVDGDILVYLDAGSEINKHGVDRFTYYLDFVARHDVLVFPIPYQHRFWVKPHSSLRIERHNFFRNQVWAGMIMLRVSDLSRRIVSRWYELAFENSGSALTEDISDGEIFPEGFKEHRHDQSILSHVIYSEKLTMIDRDESTHTPWSKGEEFPFLALRNKSGISRLNRIFAVNRWRRCVSKVVTGFDTRRFKSLMYKNYSKMRENLRCTFKRGAN